MTNIAIADLSVEKSVDDNTPKLGQEVTWSIKITNHSDTYADNVRVTDLLPSGLSYVSAQSSDGIFDESAGVWVLGGLDGGSDATIMITTVITDANYHITNFAMVSSDTHDCNPANDEASLTIVPWEPTEADLSLEKMVSNSDPSVGDIVDWTVVVENSGPDTAWSTKITDTLPEGINFLEAAASVGSYDPDTGVWAVGDLASGGSANIVISTSVDTEGGAQYVNTAVATSMTYDQNSDDNTATAVIEVAELDDDNAGKPDHGGKHERGGEPDHEHGPGQSYPVACCCTCDDQEQSGADLQIIKLVDDPTPDLNSSVTWSLMVINNGPDDAENVIVNDNLPAGVEYVSDVATMGAFDLDAGVWEIGDLPSGASALLQITTIATDATVAQVNIALVSSDTEDSNPANDFAHATIDAVNADLIISKSVDDDAPDLGGTVVWTIDVENDGPDAAENVVISDVLPADVTFVSASDARFDMVTGMLAIGDLGAGETFSFDITVTVDDAAGPRVNNASVVSDTYDDDLTNNLDNATTDAVAADLELVKGVIPNTAAPGDSVEWTITVTNQGPDDATGVAVEDILPTGVTYTADDSAGAFDVATGQWTIGDLAVGQTVSLTIQAVIVDTGQIVNVAQIVASDQFDPDSSVNNDDGDQSEDDEDTAVVTVPEIIDLELTQEISTESPAVGDTVVFTITVANTSTVDATGVTVGSDQIAGYLNNGDLTFIESSDPNVAADPTGVWTIGDINAGETVTVTIDAIVNTPGDYTNIAEISNADQVDIDSTPGNGVVTEDDQESVAFSVPNPNPVPTAGDDSYSVTTMSEPVNAVIMIDHSGSMGSKTGPDQNPSPLTSDILDANGQVTSRLQLVRDAVVEFSGTEQISSVKVMGFDADAGGAQDVSDWFDVSGATPDTSGVQIFVDSLQASGFTNYVAALEATQLNADIADAPTPTLPTNYYFLTDGNPLLPSSGGGVSAATPNAIQEAAWQTFADANFADAFGIGFGSGVTNFGALDIVSHPDDPAVTGAVTDEENTILATEADEIPADLYRTVSDSVTGNVFDNDTSGGDGPEFGGTSVTTLTVGTVVYSYDGSAVSVSVGAAPVTSSGIGSNMINTPVDSGGRLEFDFDTGSFEYFAPLSSVQLTETFEYSITDSGGDSATAVLSIDVMPGAAPGPAPLVNLLSASAELFPSDAVNDVQALDSSFDDEEWYIYASQLVFDPVEGMEAIV